ncbi:HAD family hydrolase, partial [Halobium palmae]
GGRGVAAAPEHASEDVLDHVVSTDELVYDRGEAADVLRTAYVLNLLAKLD